jgi:hypothetical protein
VETRAAALLRPRGLWLWLGLALLVAGAFVAALVGWLSLRHYSPFTNPYTQWGPVSGVVRTVDPTTDFLADKTTFYAAQKPGHVAFSFDLWNRGSHAVRLDRVYTGDFAGSRFAIYPASARVQTRDVDRGTRLGLFEPFHPVTIKPNRFVFLLLDFRTRCFPETPPGAATVATSVKVRYSYLRIFRRTQWLDLPAQIAMQCKGKLPPSTH